MLWTVKNGPCIASDTLVVKIGNQGNCLDLQLPTGFTPNGDGYNDDFFIPAIGQYPDNTFVVFNRWGNEVFRREHYANGTGHNWEGQNSKGELLPDGTYYVILVINKGEIVKNSYVDLRR
jgi:gliding motility-associated-like protein